jgi:hypothetical protein
MIKIKNTNAVYAAKFAVPRTFSSWHPSKPHRAIIAIHPGSATVRGATPGNPSSNRNNNAVITSPIEVDRCSNAPRDL